MMHVRGCTCDDCLPGVPAEPTRVTSTRRRRLTAKERKAAQNKRAYLKRTAGMYV